MNHLFENVFFSEILIHFAFSVTVRLTATRGGRCLAFDARPAGSNEPLGTYMDDKCYYVAGDPNPLTFMAWLFHPTKVIVDARGRRVLRVDKPNPRFVPGGSGCFYVPFPQWWSYTQVLQRAQSLLMVSFDLESCWCATPF